MTNVNDHFEIVVLPAVAEYFEAEECLSTATSGGDAEQIDFARQQVMRRARTASVELHQLSDYYAKLASSAISVDMVRSEVQRKCIFSPDGESVDDIDLLRDVAEAFKHHTLDRKTSSVVGADATIVLGTGWGDLRWGEGKYGGAEQVIVKKKTVVCVH